MADDVEIEIMLEIENFRAGKDNPGIQNALMSVGDVSSKSREADKASCWYCDTFDAEAVRPFVPCKGEHRVECEKLKPRTALILDLHVEQLLLHVRDLQLGSDLGAAVVGRAATN